MRPLEVLQDAWTAYTQSQFGVDPTDQEPRERIWASQFRTCTRRMALDLLYPHHSFDPDLEGMERMLRGHEREHSLIARLHQVGPRAVPPFEVIEQQQRFVVKDRDGTPLVSGKKDATVSWGRGGPRLVMEAKSGMAILRVSTFPDFENSPWTRHMPDQLLTYLFANDEPQGFFALDHVDGPHWIHVDLEEHLERVESRLCQAREAIDSSHQVLDGDNRLPPVIDDAEECRRCPHFGRSCAPGVSYGPGLVVIRDEELEALLVRRRQHETAGRAFVSADSALKKRVKAKVETGVPLNALVGPFELRGVWGGHSSQDPPTVQALHLARYLKRRKLRLPVHVVEAVDEILAAAARGFKSYDPHGAFRLEVGLVPGESEPEDDLLDVLKASLAAGAAKKKATTTD